MAVCLNLFNQVQQVNAYSQSRLPRDFSAIGIFVGPINQATKVFDNLLSLLFLEILLHERLKGGEFAFKLGFLHEKMSAFGEVVASVFD